MVYALAPGRPVPDEVRRIADELLHAATSVLRGDTDEDEAKAVHSARKRLKELRGLVRLLRGSLGDTAFRELDMTFRDIGRALSALRDADVLVATVEGLAQRHGDDAAAATLAVHRAAAQRRDAARRHADELSEIPAAIAALDAARAQVAEWPLEHDGFAAVEEGLRRTYRQGAQRMRVAADERTAEAAHDWRKRVKHLWYHLQLLTPAWPAVLEPTADEAHALSDLLGDAHDLDVLVHVLHEEDLALHAGAVTIVTRLADDRRRVLESEAHHLGARLYAESAKAFTDRLRAYADAAATVA